MPAVTGLPAPGGTSPDKERRGRLDRVLSFIERAGNALPNPIVLFAGLFALLAVVSTVLALAGVSVTVPGTDDTKSIGGLLTGEGLRWLLENLIPNFATFPPIGAVLVLIMVVGLAEKTGLLETAMRATLARVPRAVLPYAVAIIASQAHMMSDVGAIVLPPLAALVFKSAGRHPVAGLIGGFACVTAGYAAGFTIGSLDALYVGITQQAASVLPAAEGLHIHVLINYFFTAASSVVLGLLGGFLISRVLEPRLGTYQAADGEATGEDLTLTPVQRKGLAVTCAVVGVYLAAVLALWLPPGAPLRGEGGAFVPSPVLTGVVPVLFGAFLLAGLTYGFTVKQLTGTEDVVTAMTDSVKNMSGYIVMMFFAAQVIAVFTWSNLGVLLAVKAAALFNSIGVTGFWAIIAFVLLASCLNLVILSGSALWSLVGPVFIPAFMLMDMSPALSQAAFRIGDSATGAITPMNPYLLLVLAMVREYEPEARLGTLISRLAIFVVPFLVVWLAILGIFYGLDLPLGPGAHIGVK
ncbi:AbgT family transporter [Streptomyces rhizosphaericus]|uniref:AbgT family transporter n=1 Tax=Streptomyces rhizosphaericus TaxID=114699 RepID=A0A6G4A9V5_9ACTN|nr:AbgT family transporter [Streptomyces rhizosphaericus]MBI0375757.1 AbgT family transporter [Streptomyces albiflaviniger]NEW70085.1 AbgT family transporter [Streptomyces rhizosphaericus]